MRWRVQSKFKPTFKILAEALWKDIQECKGAVLRELGLDQAQIIL